MKNIQGYYTPDMRLQKHKFQPEHHGSFSFIARVHFHIWNAMHRRGHCFLTSIYLLQAIIGQFLKWYCLYKCCLCQIYLIHCLHDFAHKQDSQLNSSVLITVWRVAVGKGAEKLQCRASISCCATRSSCCRALSNCWGAPINCCSAPSGCRGAPICCCGYPSGWATVFTVAAAVLPTAARVLPAVAAVLT